MITSERKERIEELKVLEAIDRRFEYLNTLVATLDKKCDAIRSELNIFWNEFETSDALLQKMIEERGKK
jgi:uncharacterized coiled-coil protein SlyX